MIRSLDALAGSYGFGRVDMIENRRVGIKSRELYEVPGALSIIAAHRALEDVTLERDLAHHKPGMEARWADLVYDGQWFSPLREAIDAYIEQTQSHVTGEVRLRYEPGTCTVVGRRSEHSLYDLSLATYGVGRRVRSVRLARLRHALRPAAQGVVGEAAAGRMSEDAGPLWAGRFSTPPAPEAQALGRSLEVDERLVFQDVQAGIAHVAALRDAGLVTAEEAGASRRGVGGGA